jgi:hypothetical protein
VHAGQTHRDGDYKKVVERGLAALTSRAQATAGGSSYHERGATMYGHGLATLALCETYARTNDDRLKAPAQAAVNFTINAQDPVGGGWRYNPRQAGDTSVTGWQLTGLQIATTAGLRVPENALRAADNFLNSVQSDGGARYGYSGPGQGQATTAIGLLGRLQLGHKADEPAIVRGLEYLVRGGPSTENWYYNLYATKFMRAAQGDQWQAWRVKMRTELLAGQEKNGHPAGSFTVTDSYGTQGGRLYCTCLCTLIYADVQDEAK